MTLESAQKAIRRGAIAGFILTAIHSARIAISIWRPIESLQTWNDLSLYLDVIIILLLSFGLLRRSRIAAMSLIFYYTFGSIIFYLETNRAVGLLWTVVFLYFFAKAAYGTFAYHRICRKRDPAYRPVKKIKYFLWVPAGILGAIFVGFTIWGSYEIFLRAIGDALDADTPVYGVSGRYTLRPPDWKWIQVDPGTIQEKTDLELYGSTTDTWVVVYFYCTKSENLDSLTEYRRTEVSREVEGFSVAEERQIMPETFIPVSYARYAGDTSIAGSKQTWWVATVVTDNFYVEVIASTTGGPREESKIENLVKSLRLVQDADRPCDAS